ncbi:hypothetical protein GGR21_002969 [Dysgonomonas hofstadii]|uniref:Transcription regulator BetR N-terminal domain-containing protein n=1 Tax=Dysgonomonas hofstadii TaxID=637886 RepID=A0A840CW72_9BACT|nr:helix-turn-helix domain-containing protein [Dysgonomonas hofstadii]MBB4037055.1 hypothetical protein [Dysgonomonas hofstadii]
MNQDSLQKSFTGVLENRFRNKKHLVTQISDILRIERGAALRRINGTVPFTVNEMGILAHNLNISIDNLLQKDKNINILPLMMMQPNKAEAFDDLISFIDKICSKTKGSPNKGGAVFDSLPLEFFVLYPSIVKFFYYKWNHNFIKTRELNNFSSWEYPGQLEHYHNELIKVIKKIDKITYIWDIPVIWNLAKDISYYHCLKVLRDEDVDSLKNELASMLDNIELLARGSENNTIFEGEVELYIPNCSIGLYSSYFISENNMYCYTKSNFISSLISQDPKTCLNIEKWINSLKKVSTLISGTGDIDRTLFFEEQRKIVDSICSCPL